MYKLKEQLYFLNNFGKSQEQDLWRTIVEEDKVHYRP